MRLDVVDEPLLIFAHAEKIVGFFTLHGFLVVVRTFPVHQFPLRVEAFAPDAIEALVGAEIDVPCLVDLLEDVLDDLDMGLVRRSDELVVADVELRPGFPKDPADPVHILLGSHPRLSGRLHDFVPVFVGTRQEVRPASHETMESREDVRHHGRVGMADVRFRVHIVDWSGDVKRLGHEAPFSIGPKRFSTSRPSSIRTVMVLSRTFWRITFPRPSGSSIFLPILGMSFFSSR